MRSFHNQWILGAGILQTYISIARSFIFAQGTFRYAIAMIRFILDIEESTPEIYQIGNRRQTIR